MRLPLAMIALLWVAPAAARAEPGGHTWHPVSEWYKELLAPSEMSAFAPTAEQSELRVRDGDDPRWAVANFDDSGWKVADRYSALPRNAGVFWVRFHTRATAPGTTLPTGFFVGETAASEIYWDGVLVHRCGQPGPDRASEVPGPVYSLFDLPGSAVRPGDHLVAMRLSTYWFDRPDKTMNLLVGNVAMGDMMNLSMRGMIVPLLGVGALAFFGVAAIIIWVSAGRPKGMLLFAGLNLGGAVTLFSIHVRHLFPLPYSWSYPVWTATEVLVAATAACLLSLVLVKFDLPWRRWLVGAFVTLEAAACVQQALAYHLIGPIKFMIFCWRAAFIGSIVLLGWALLRRRRGAIYVLITAALAAFWYEANPERFLSMSFFPTMLPLLLSFVLVIGLDVQEERTKARDARLTAARLELELLRKSLQPHFLMNTLTVLSQAMEENPGMAARLIEDLAGEMRELAQFAEHKEVPLSRELDLCRTHLRVMSTRTEKPWHLEVEGADPEATVPPALFFNLIENGFTHQQPIEGANAFRLRSEATRDGIRYVFFSPGGVRTPPDRKAGGNGLRYVKARLDEGWPGRWSFDHGPVAGGWETRIELRHGPERRTQ
jgi:hypothetical protein